VGCGVVNWCVGSGLCLFESYVEERSSSAWCVGLLVVFISFQCLVSPSLLPLCGAVVGWRLMLSFIVFFKFGV